MADPIIVNQPPSGGGGGSGWGAGICIIIAVIILVIAAIYLIPRLRGGEDKSDVDVKINLPTQQQTQNPQGY